MTGIFFRRLAADEKSKKQGRAGCVLAEFVPRELCVLLISVLHLKAEEGLVRDSILGIWGLTSSTPCSNTDILHFTKSLCLLSFKEKILKEITDEGTKDFIRV